MTTETARRLVCRRVYWTDSIGTVPAEKVKVCRRADGLPAGWWVVSFLTGPPGTVCMHETRIAAEVTS